MDPTTSPLAFSDLGQTRRDFVRSASLLGAATFAGAANLRAAASAAEDGARIQSLTTPLQPGGRIASGESVPLAPPDKQPPNLKVPEPVKKKVGWAVVGLGKLALEQVMPAFRECKHSKPTALVSGHASKAKKVAEAYEMGDAKIYDYAQFDKLAEDDSVDVVYIILPNSLHAEFTVRALKAGKHVLCEKPMAVSEAECEQMIQAAKAAKRKLGVAYRLHHEPHTMKAFSLAREKAIGDLKMFTSSNCQTIQAPNIRLSRELGGGAVSDLGVYSINAARHLLREEPVEVTAFAHWPERDPRFRETPEAVSYVLRFPSGVLAQCDCSFGTAGSSRFRLLGTKGFVEMDPAFPYEGQRLRISEMGQGEGEQKMSEPKLKSVNQFTEEIDYFSQCVMDDREFKTPGEDGLADIRVVLGIYESLRTGKPARIGAPA